MRIKKFTGRSFQEAFEQVKAELGADAVILNSRKIKEGGLLDFMSQDARYEITAAVDPGNGHQKTSPRARQATQTYREMVELAQQARQNGNGNGNGNGNERAAQQTTAAEEALLKARLQEQTREIRSLQDEIKDIKKVLNQVADFLKYSRMPALPELFKNVLKTLTDNEVHEDLAKAIVQTIYSKMPASNYKNKAAVENALQALLMRMIKVAPPLEKARRHPYVVALVGPTGVGKTTTIAKLAANLKLYGNRKVGLISADTYRIAAIEQLQTFANIANIPMTVTYSPEDMREAIRKFRQQDIILIDTVGRNPKNEEHLRMLQQFVEMANPDEVHLVLSLTTGFKTLLDVIRRFKMMRPNRLIFTKLDEAINTGNMLNVLYKYQIPISYLTNGQVVPNDITVAEKQTIANLIYKGVLN